MSDNLISASQFCDLHGVGESDRFVIQKKFSGKTLTYEAWHTLVSEHMDISEAKKFKPSKPKEPTENKKKTTNTTTETTK